MCRNSRRVLVLFFFMMVFVFSISTQERWSGPVILEDFRFDKMGIYAIGWSANGEFAYGVVSPTENGGSYWQWYILDLIDDVILFESPRWTLLEEQTPAQLWELHPEWYPQLIRFGITPDEKFSSGGQIFEFENSSYRMTYTLDRSESEDHPEGLTKNIRIDLFKDNSSGKTVYSYSPGADGDLVEDMILKGYVLSPFENRTAIVSLEKSALSGEKATWKYRIIGAHLKVGFSVIKQKGSALAEAVLNGQFYVSRMLLQEGAYPDSKDSRGYSPLLIASRLGHWRIAALLIESGADVNPGDDRGRNPLHYAAEEGNEEIVRELIQAGADPGVKDLNGQTPGDLADSSGNNLIRRLLRP